MRWRADAAQRGWRRERSPRAAALAAAAGLNLAGWALLDRSASPAPPAAPAPTAAAAVAMVRLLPAAVEPPRRAEASTAPADAATPRGPRPRRSPREAGAPARPAPAITVAPTQATAAEPAAPTASSTPSAAPLDLGAGVLREAARRSRGGARAMAEAAGRPLGDDAPGAADAMTEGVRRAARPDCRHAHADKGLLAAPLLLWDTLRDRGCRW